MLMSAEMTLAAPPFVARLSNASVFLRCVWITEAAATSRSPRRRQLVPDLGGRSRTWELHAPSAFLVVIIAVAAAPYVLLTATRVRST